jgi:hypothetical protein
MNVTTIGQGPGSVATLQGRRTAEHSVERGLSQEARFARVAWFDVNGDGQISDRKDGTLLLPQHAAKVQTYSRDARRPEVRVAELTEHKQVNQSEDEAEASTQVDGKAAPSEPATPVAVSDVQTRQAISAYQRYGQASEAAAPSERAVA